MKKEISTDGAGRKDSGLPSAKTYKRVNRIAPPLVITEDEVDWACKRIDSVLTALKPETENLTAAKELV